MKKLSLLVGTLGGAMAGYLFSNKDLRDKLAKCDTPEEAAKLLGQHLQKDGKKLAGQVQEFVQSDEIQKNLSTAKKFATEKFEEAKKSLNALSDEGMKNAKTKVKKGTAKVQGTAKRTAKKGVKIAKRTAKKGVAKAKKVARRVQAQTRTLS